MSAPFAKFTGLSGEEFAVNAHYVESLTNSQHQSKEDPTKWIQGVSIGLHLSRSFYVPVLNIQEVTTLLASALAGDK